MNDKCRYFGSCGGCSLQEDSYEQQLIDKASKLFRTLEDVAKVTPAFQLPSIAASPWGYRHRARLSVQHLEKSEQLLIGFRERERSQFVTNMDHCPVLVDAVSKLIRPLRETLIHLESDAHIPQLEVVATDSSVALIIRHIGSLAADHYDRLRGFAESHDVRLFLQSDGPDTLVPLHPDDTYLMEYSLPDFDISLEFHIAQFVQINPQINRMMVRQLVDLLDPQVEEPVADLFCGVGNFALPLARKGAKVLGLEWSAESVQCAQLNADRNGLSDKAVFMTDDLDRASQAKVRQLAQFEKMVLDPPRSGAEAVVSCLDEAGPRRIVYVSCNPSTLARDAGLLVHQKGYSLAHCGLIDMFPHTDHMEAMAVFER